MPTRDNQRRKVYEAEYYAFNRAGDSPAEFTLKEAQKFVNRISSRGLYQKLGGPRGVIVKSNPRRRTMSMMVSPFAIELADGWGYNKDVILHEMTHVLIYHVSRRSAHHGLEFVLLYRRLVEQEMGIEQRRKLDLGLEKYGAKWGVNGSEWLKKKLADL